MGPAISPYCKPVLLCGPPLLNPPAGTTFRSFLKIITIYLQLHGFSGAGVDLLFSVQGLLFFLLSSSIEPID